MFYLLLRLIHIDRSSVSGRSSGHVTVVREPLFVHTHCILTLESLPIDEEFNLLFAGATDGQILIFDITKAHPEETASSYEPILTLSHHQSGVNAIALRRSTETDLIVISGGDDNCITISNVDTLNKSADLIQKIPSQHSAQITGSSFSSEFLVSVLCCLFTGSHRCVIASDSTWYIPLFQLVHAKKDQK